MISVAEARARILAGISPLPSEQVGVSEALGRVLAEDIVARVSQPPHDVSAMDGWAARSVDLGSLPATLREVAAVPAGHPTRIVLGPGEAARIFTGGVVPAGADTVVLQEDCTLAEDGTVTVNDGGAPGRWIRRAGLDFRQGDVGLKAGTLIGPRQVALIAAMNVPWVRVRRRPRVAILPTGDEIVMPGDPLGGGQIVSSNSLALSALVRANGGEPLDLGIAGDRIDSLLDRMTGAVGTDILLTSGGVSVGDHDLVRAALNERGLDLQFWKIALRPGKPLMFGRMGATSVIGLPGNPVSSLVCAILFVRPLLRALSGLADLAPPTRVVRLGRDLPANDRREDYLRATLTRSEDGIEIATPFPQQDSSMLSCLAHAQCLLIRPPLAPAAPAGTPVSIIALDETS